MGERVFVQDKETYDILEGTVTMLPTTKNKFYPIELLDDSLLHDVNPSNMYNVDSLCFFQPDWLKQD